MTISDSAFARLRTQHEAIPFIIDGLDGALLAERPEPTTWSIAENMAHLVRYQEVFPERVRRILDEDVPTFERYHAELDAGFAAWAALPPDEIWSGIAATRASIIDLLTSLTPDEAARCGRHPLLGAAPIPVWVEFFILHEAHHLFTILKLAGAFRGR